MDKTKTRKGKASETLILDDRIHKNKQVVDTVVYSMRRPALQIRNGEKRYGNGLILHNLNLFSKEGQIYCLVGAEKSGKTTILECIVGLKRLTKGDILVFGTSPGSSQCGIPGRRVGYQPQELTLYKEFSIREVLQYHGRMNGLTQPQISKRTEKLAELLDLQRLNSPLRELSSALQMRASLACAILHEPEIIVLDQPTMGMDILVQKGIWMHLHNLVSNGRTSVILTTQNIEESIQAHKVGVLRNGRLLLEDSPSSLLERHGTQSLAEVVARFSIKDTMRLKVNDGDEKDAICVGDVSAFGIPSGTTGIGDSGNGPNVLSSVSYREWMAQVVHCDDDQFRVPKEKTNKFIPKKERTVDDVPPFPNPSRFTHRFRALVIKQFKIYLKHVWLCCLSFLIPFVVLCAFCHCIGTNFTNLKVGVVNEDGWDSEHLNEENCTIVEGCTNKMLSCRLLDTIGDNGSVIFELFESEDEAVRALSLGKIHAYLIIMEGFNSATYSRIMKLENENENSTELKFVFDESNIFITQFLRLKLQNGAALFEKELTQDCKKIEEKKEAEPLKSALSLSSTQNSSANSFEYSDFYLSGILVLIAFFSPLFTSGAQYIRERREGLIARVMASGANSIEVLLVHVIFRLPIIFGQTAILIFVPGYLFNIGLIPILSMGWLWKTLMLGMVGIAGMSFALLLGTISKNISHTHAIGILALLCGITLSGTVWPVLAQHWVLQWISLILPWTLTTSSLRQISKEAGVVDILERRVWDGFAAIGAWIGIYWILIILLIFLRFMQR